jgi:hypothetical protein
MKIVDVTVCHHEIGRFHEVFKQFGQLFWESGGLLESLKTSLSHKNNHFAKAYKHAESILKWKIVDVTVCHSWDRSISMRYLNSLVSSSEKAGLLESLKTLSHKITILPKLTNMLKVFKMKIVDVTVCHSWDRSISMRYLNSLVSSSEKAVDF